MDHSVSDNDGITLFLVSRDANGVNITPVKRMDGGNACILELNNVSAGDGDIIGEKDGGYPVLSDVIDQATTGLCIEMVGGMNAALNMTVDYITERVQFGKPIAYNQAIQHRLADMTTELEAARLMIYEASRMKDAGQPFSHYSAMCKLYASEVGRRAAESALTVMGSIGYISGKYPAERIWRDVKLCEIGEGTSEIQRLVIARYLLKEIQKK